MYHCTCVRAWSLEATVLIIRDSVSLVYVAVERYISVRAIHGWLMDVIEVVGPVILM